MGQQLPVARVSDEKQPLAPVHLVTPWWALSPLPFTTHCSFVVSWLSWAVPASPPSSLPSFLFLRLPAPPYLHPGNNALNISNGYDPGFQPVRIDAITLQQGPRPQPLLLAGGGCVLEKRSQGRAKEQRGRDLGVVGSGQQLLTNQFGTVSATDAQRYQLLTATPPHLTSGCLCPN